MLIGNNMYRRISMQRGFSLVEMMLAMVIGLIITAGIMTMYQQQRDTQRSSEDQLQLLADARFAIDTIAYDIRQAGIYGGTNDSTSLLCRADSDLTDNIDPTQDCPEAAGVAGVAADDCEPGWFLQLDRPIVASDGVTDFAATCTSNGYKANTDFLGVRYADSTPTVTASLAGGVAYVRSNFRDGAVFIGNAVPNGGNYDNLYRWDDATGFTNNHVLVSRAYYISNYTDSVGDGIPSLRRVNLQTGPTMVDEVLLPGVEDFQLQFGVDLDDDYSIDSYVNADNVGDWTKVYAAKIWLLMRTMQEDKSGIAGSQEFTIAGNTVNTVDDGYRRFLTSSVIRMRNTVNIDRSE